LDCGAVLSGKAVKINYPPKIFEIYELAKTTIAPINKCIE
jgi:hypothetical protein